MTKKKMAKKPTAIQSHLRRTIQFDLGAGAAEALTVAKRREAELATIIADGLSAVFQGVLARNECRQAAEGIVKTQLDGAGIVAWQNAQLNPDGKSLSVTVPVNTGDSSSGK